MLSNAEGLGARHGDSATARRRPAPKTTPRRNCPPAPRSTPKVRSKTGGVSEILVSTSLVTMRKFCEGKEGPFQTAIELNSQRDRACADARVAMRRLHAAKLPLAYVLLAKTEQVRGPSRWAPLGDGDRLAEDCELVHRDATAGRRS